jgi:hypothetical protein
MRNNVSKEKQQAGWTTGADGKMQGRRVTSREPQQARWTTGADGKMQGKRLEAKKARKPSGLL